MVAETKEPEVPTDQPPASEEQTPSPSVVDETVEQQDTVAKPEDTSDWRDKAKAAGVDVAAISGEEPASTESKEAEEAAREADIRRVANRMRDTERAAEKRQTAVAEDWEAAQVEAEGLIEAGKPLSRTLLKQVGEKYARHEFLPDAIAALQEGPQATKAFSEFPEEVQAAILEVKGDLGDMSTNSWRKFEEALTERIEARTKKTGLPVLKRAENVAFEAGRQTGLAEGRGVVAPNLGVGGAAAGGKAYKDMTFEEQGQQTSEQRDAETAMFVRTAT